MNLSKTPPILEHMSEWLRKLYLGDNLEIMRAHVENESVDLVYLDPPFNPNQTYNVKRLDRSQRPKTSPA